LSSTTCYEELCLTPGRSAAAGCARGPLDRRVSCLPWLGCLCFSSFMLGTEPRPWCRGCVKHALDADVLINVRPVDTLPRADQSEVGTLGRGRVRESPRPSQRNTDNPAVCEARDDLVFRNSNLTDEGVSARRSGHTMPP